MSDGRPKVAGPDTGFEQVEAPTFYDADRLTYTFRSSLTVETTDLLEQRQQVKLRAQRERWLKASREKGL